MSMTTRERFRAVVSGQPFDRLPIIEWAMWWNQTIDRPAEVSGRYDLYRHFGRTTTASTGCEQSARDVPKRRDISGA